ncbi:MAG: hypothetical protein ACOY0T_27580 [Myxococcota bacterium]
MSDTPKSTGFWTGVDAKLLIATIAGLGTLLGPVSQLVEGHYKLRLDALEAEHKLRLDFIERLVKAQELDDPSARVLARLDVLQLLRGTLPKDDGMTAFVGEELARTKQQYESLLALQQARADAPTQAASPAAPHDPAPAPDKEAVAKVKRAERELSSRLLLTAPRPQPTITVAPAPAVAQPCKRYSASAPGSSVPPAQLQEACQAADVGAERWMARAAASLVTCSCAER